MVAGPGVLDKSMLGLIWTVAFVYGCLSEQILSQAGSVIQCSLLTFLSPQEVDIPCSVSDSPWSGFGLASLLLAIIIPVIIGPIITWLLHCLLSVAFRANKVSLPEAAEMEQERRNLCCNLLLLAIFISTYVTSMIIRESHHDASSTNSSEVAIDS